MTTLDFFPTPAGPALSVARRLREAERERLLLEKTAPARAAEAEERRQRAEQHRLQALPGLADRLAVAVFDHVEANAGRPVVRDQLADALLAVLLRSGIARDARFPPTGGV
jgi:hypothetical protein